MLQQKWEKLLRSSGRDEIPETRQERRKAATDGGVSAELVWAASVLTPRLMSDLTITVFLKAGNET